MITSSSPTIILLNGASSVGKTSICKQLQIVLDDPYMHLQEDAFVFDKKPNTRTNKDAIKDFKVVDDTVRLDNAAFTKVGANGTLKSSAFWTNNTGKAHDKDDRIIYDKDSGVLYYDADGSGKGAAVAFATITKKLGMTNKDFYII